MNQLVQMILAHAARDPGFQEDVLNHPEQLRHEFPLTQQELDYLHQFSPGDLVGAQPGPPDALPAPIRTASE